MQTAVHFSMKNHAAHALGVRIMRDQLIEKATVLYRMELDPHIGKSQDEFKAAMNIAWPKFSERLRQVNEWYADNLHADAFPEIATPIPTFD